MSAAQFKAAYAALIRKKKSQADAITRKVAMDLLVAIIARSPVDTGRFRGNWQTGIGGAVATTTSGNDTSGNSSTQRLATALSKWRTGQTIYITNSLPYARRLEYGWSKQAPGGMVRLTIVEYGAYLRKVVKAIK